jgi:hypothetical protein
MRTRYALAAAVVLAIALAISVASFAQAPRGKAEATIGAAKVSIDYGRPSLKGRDMLGKAPPGTVWRLGADQATTLTTSADLVFDALVIPKGSYSLFAKRVDEKNWVLIFNEQTGQWGTNHDAALDLGGAPLAWTKKDDSTEQFTIEIAAEGDGGAITITWGKNVLKASFKQTTS